MKPVTIKKIKDELNYKSSQELIELCLLLSKFKKENKELLTYLLFDKDDEETYIPNFENLKTIFLDKKILQRFRFQNLIQKRKQSVLLCKILI